MFRESVFLQVIYLYRVSVISLFFERCQVTLITRYGYVLIGWLSAAVFQNTNHVIKSHTTWFPLHVLAAVKDTATPTLLLYSTYLNESVVEVATSAEATNRIRAGEGTNVLLRVSPCCS